MALFICSRNNGSLFHCVCKYDCNKSELEEIIATTNEKIPIFIKDQTIETNKQIVRVRTNYSQDKLAKAISKMDHSEFQKAVQKGWCNLFTNDKAIMICGFNHGQKFAYVPGHENMLHSIGQTACDVPTFFQHTVNSSCIKNQYDDVIETFADLCPDQVVCAIENLSEIEFNQAKISMKLNLNVTKEPTNEVINECDLIERFNKAFEKNTRPLIDKILAAIVKYVEESEASVLGQKIVVYKANNYMVANSLLRIIRKRIPTGEFDSARPSSQGPVNITYTF